MKSLLAFALLISATALAQGPPPAHFPWWEGPIARGLNLTEDQEDQIQTILKAHRNLMIDQRAATEKAEAELQDLFDDPGALGARASEIIGRLAGARDNMTRTYMEMSYKLRRVLTDEQWTTLKKRRMRFEKGIRPMNRPSDPRRPSEPGKPLRPDSHRTPSRPPAQDI